MVPLKRMTSTRTPYFIFQKERVVYEDNDDDGLFMFRKVQSPTNLSLKTYVSASGINNDDVGYLHERYGHNRFDISLPTFIDLYIEGLLSPFTVFQV